MKYIYIVIYIFIFGNISGQRIIYNLNHNWQFRFSHQVERKFQKVILPHTWNAIDALAGKSDYKRGLGNYERKLFIDSDLRGKRLFLKFNGVNTVANVFINGKHLGEHRGGYSAFIFEITDIVDYGKNNTVLVRVNNGEQLEVMPLIGDFNIYGGIYRDVELIVTNDLCISPLDYASSGVYFKQFDVNTQKAEIETLIKVSNRGLGGKANLELKIKDGDSVIKSIIKKINLNKEHDFDVKIPFVIDNPHLWNGIEDPFMYDVDIVLYKDSERIDSISEKLGLRSFYLDPDNGLFLNGENIRLKGVCRHQDRPEIGNALHKIHHEEDIDLILEMGANAVRLAHYQHAEYTYDLTDKYGLIVWAEIPFVGPGGYIDEGFTNIDSFKDNGKQQLIELIRQNYNHPSIFFWGLFNELTQRGDDPVPYIKELNNLAKTEDSTRITVSASNQSGEMNCVTDGIAWNKYYGWYGGNPDNLDSFLDETHKEYPKLCIGISEYGAGASIYHQQDSLKQTIPNSWWHPENWQLYYHIENWKIISSKKYVWGSFIWNMFDFGVASRREGDRPGINDKGLVTFDRKVKKDAYFFYKANWNKEEPVLYISSKRCIDRYNKEQELIIFSNIGRFELFVNGISYGIYIPDSFSMVKENIKLKEGKNSIIVRSCERQELEDRMNISLEKYCK